VSIGTGRFLLRPFSHVFRPLQAESSDRRRPAHRPLPSFQAQRSPPRRPFAFRQTDPPTPAVLMDDTAPSSESRSADSPSPSSAAQSPDQLFAILGEVLDLLAGLEARQKVLAREIAALRAQTQGRPTEEVVQELNDLFKENLEEERNSVLSRVSISSDFPPGSAGASDDA
jgi:hypothetical protein